MAAASGRREVVQSENRSGRYARSRIPEGKATADIAFDATVRAAAPHQIHRRKEGVAISVEGVDLREKVREKKSGCSIVFVVDSSGSMGANRRMEEVKGALLSLLIDAYQRRDRVGMVAFRGERAEVVLPLTDSVELAQKRLETLPTGGRTPLAERLDAARGLFMRERKRPNHCGLLMVLISDGRANTGSASRSLEEALTIADSLREARVRSIVIDTESGLVRIGNMEKLAARLNAVYRRIESLRADTVAGLVRAETFSSL